jgi:predicted component of type VI protein secretion system
VGGAQHRRELAIGKRSRQLDPRDLATRFERSARRKTMGNWELYGDFYRSLCETPPGTLPHIFVETFAQSYDQVAREGDQASAHSSDAA